MENKNKLKEVREKLAKKCGEIDMAFTKNDKCLVPIRVVKIANN